MIYDVNGVDLAKAYDINANMQSVAYDVDGLDIWHSHKVSNRFTRTVMFTLSDIPGGTQGIACDSLSQTIAQLYSGRIVTIDAETGEWTNRVDSFDLGHGGAGQFAPTKVNPSDPFPPLYVSGQQNYTVNNVNYQRIYEVYIGANGCTLNRLFFVPAPAGSNGMSAIDFERNVFWQFTSPQFNPDPTIESSTVYKYDFTQFEPIETTSHAVNGNYVFTDLLDTFTVPFVPEMQSLSYFDGLIACQSDLGSNEVVFIDVDKKDVYLTINRDISPAEQEGIGFMYNPDTGQTDMILSSRDFKYYRYEFIL